MNPLIKVNNLRKSYFTPAGELKVLKGIDLEIHRGEVIAIVGASGVGKSTFLHILGALDRPTEGEVIIDGINVFKLPEEEISRLRNSHIGFVFQFHYLLPEFTAIENILMPVMINLNYRHRLLPRHLLLLRHLKRRPTEGGRVKILEERDKYIERAEYLMKELGIYERRDHRPGELSGGEQQRVAIARALILEPEVVLADEPTGNLDTRTGEELFDLILELNRKKGITFVIVTHNITLARRCSRILRMIDGRIFEEV